MDPETIRISIKFVMFFWMSFWSVFVSDLGLLWYSFGVVFGPRLSKSMQHAMYSFDGKTVGIRMILRFEGDAEVTKVSKIGIQETMINQSRF